MHQEILESSKILGFNRSYHAHPYINFQNFLRQSVSLENWCHNESLAKTNERQEGSHNRFWNLTLWEHWVGTHHDSQNLSCTPQLKIYHGMLELLNFWNKICAENDKQWWQPVHSCIPHLFHDPPPPPSLIKQTNTHPFSHKKLLQKYWSQCVEQKWGTYI